MNEVKLYLLKLINEINNSEAVAIPSLDMRIMRKYPEVIYSKKLKEYLLDLKNYEYIEFMDEMTVAITSKGIQHLKST